MQILIQNEKAFQKQNNVFVGPKRRVVGGKIKSGETRYWKNIGLGIKTPKEAIEGKYVDKKCPFTSDVSIRGRVLSGIVQSKKMKNTIILSRDFLHFIKKYQRFEKHHKTLPAHCSPAFLVNEGDKVIVGECRYAQFANFGYLVILFHLVVIYF